MPFHTLFEHDPYAMMTRVLSADAAITVADIGANVGRSSVRVTDVFPRARVHAFEPTPEAFDELRDRAGARPGITAVPAAVGCAPGKATFHVTADGLSSSLFAPNDAGRRAYGKLYRVERSIEVSIITLDEWADEHDVAGYDLIKIDVQGAELDVLRGAERMLRYGASGIVCEAQIVAAYDGAATLTDIDGHLRERGYHLHQLHEVASGGADRQTTYVNGLWLSSAAREQLRTAPLTTLRVGKGGLTNAVARASRAVHQAAADGALDVVLYGAGRHTLGLAGSFEWSPIPIVAIIDDDPDRQGSTIGGVPVLSPREAMALEPGAVVLSSDDHEATMRKRARWIAEGGVPVIGLYDDVACMP